MAAYTKTISLAGTDDAPPARATIHSHNETYGSWVTTYIRSGQVGQNSVEVVVSLSLDNAITFAHELIAAAKAAGWVEVEPAREVEDVL